MTTHDLSHQDNVTLAQIEAITPRENIKVLLTQEQMTDVYTEMQLRVRWDDINAAKLDTRWRSIHFEDAPTTITH